MFAHRWILFWIIVTSSVLKSENQSDDFCAKARRTCFCYQMNIYPNFQKYRVDCRTFKGFKSQVIMDITFEGDIVMVRCDHAVLPLPETIPDLSEYINTTRVLLDNCSVPMNRSFYDYTSKISKNMRHLSLILPGDNDVDRDFNTKCFERLAGLESLHLKLIRNIDFRIPLENVFNKLVELTQLSIRNLPTPNGIFDELKQLQNLSIESTFLASSLPFGLFKNQRKLTELNIEGYSVITLHPHLFANLTELETLKFNKFGFESLPENMLHHNHKLKSFQLTNSFRKVENLPCNFFANMWNLKTISLKSTNLEHITEDIFKNSTNITKIEIFGTKFKSLPKNIFKDQINLFYLDLRHNLLENITDGLFDSLTSLKVLILSHNKLSSLSK